MNTGERSRDDSGRDSTHQVGREVPDSDPNTSRVDNSFCWLRHTVSLLGFAMIA